MKRRGRPRKPRHMKVGVTYWEGATFGRRRLYSLRKVISPRGGTTTLTRPMSMSEAKAFVAGWNARLKRGKVLMPPKK